MKELNEAKVLAVGPGAMDKDGKRIPMGVQAGDRVLIPQVCRPGRCGIRSGWRVDMLTMDYSSAAARSRSARRSTPFSGITSMSSDTSLSLSP